MSEQGNHTAGEWTYFVGNANGRGLIRIEQEGTGKHIASMPRGAESEANARLIAAAPDLLEALKVAQSVMGSHELQDSKYDYARAMARAALSKAGVTP